MISYDEGMGERLGRYAVLRHLASGGMADVLLGRTEGIEGFERHVVLKRIRPEHAKDNRFIQMFLDEARVAANLHHQNIVQVHDIGEVSGEYFFAMEYIHGKDLRELLSAVSKTRTHMPLGYVCAIVGSAAAGLHYAHERRGPDKRPLNIVHRDVSPSNVLIGYDGAVKIVDFGIAKARMRQVETRSGSLKGKVSYMSPEQCKGEDIDRRSDVYALGVLLYELATTTRLFKGDNDYLVMDAIVQGKVPPPRSRRADLPNDMSSIIMRALSTDPTRRYQTADELRLALDTFAVKHGLTAGTSALASYMHQMFGDVPEPWLDTAAPAPNVDVDGPTEAARATWTEMPREQIEAAAASSSGPIKTITDKRRRASDVEVAATIAPPITTRETRTSMKMGWESRVSAAISPRNKLLWIAAPVLLIAAFVGWRLAAGGGDETKTAAAQEPAPAVRPAVKPEPVAPQPEVPAVRIAGAEPDAAVEDKVPDKKPPPLATTPAKKPKKEAKVVAAPAGSAAPVAVATPVPAPTPPPAPTPEELEAQMPTLSSAQVAAVAADHSRQLTACEGGAELHGEVQVAFEIDASGRVVKSHLMATIKNPPVAGCILKTVQGWKFSHPPATGAKGVYSTTYQ